jgi:UDPglucose 6-dehydrogenase
VAILGLAFKPFTDDMRQAPALEVVRQLEDLGAIVVATDPVALARARPLLPGTSLVDDPYDAVTGADAVGLVTEWPVYRELDWGRVFAQMRGRLVVDGRNCLDSRAITGRGGIYVSMGRRTRGLPETTPGSASEAATASVPPVPLG